MVLNGPVRRLKNVIYETINGEMIKKVAGRMSGMAIASGINADKCDILLNSRMFKNHVDT